MQQQQQQQDNYVIVCVVVVATATGRRPTYDRLKDEAKADRTLFSLNMPVVRYSATTLSFPFAT